MPASLRRPPPTVTLFLVLTLSSAASVAWGIWSMRTVGETTANGVAIGAGTAVGILSLGMLYLMARTALVIEFGTVSTTSSDDIDTSRACLRIPIGRLARAEAVRVLDHYRRIASHEIVVNPGFYLGRVRFGLIAAPICFLAAAIGYVRQEHGVDANGELNLILMIAGLLCGIGALVVAAIAALLSREQHRRRW